ncbi:MAG: DUF2326 domain-containing protein [Clostridiales bacterium]|nr:DUF2326 domain-containing protein [Clostridiales bacterium]
MKLSKLYANNPSFKSIVFNEGTNIIIGRIKNYTTKNANCHNLGKSLIVRLIDFLLLKDTNKIMFLDNEILKDYVFFLELHLNDGKYVTIMRSIQNSKFVSLKIHSDGNQSFSTNDNWDYENLRVNTKSATIESAQEILQNLLGFDILKGVKYRHSLTYFLRGQEDYNDPFILEKYKRGQDKYWKPVLLELLGYNGELLSQIYKLNEEIGSLNEEINALKQAYNISEKEIDKYQGIKSVLESRITELSNSAERFDFYLREARISETVVNEIEKRISYLNTIVYSLKKDISNIEEALKIEMDYNYDDVLELYEEVGIHFPNELLRNYEQLIEFNKKICYDRHLKLQELLDERKKALSEKNIALKKLNDERIEALDELQRIEAFQKYKDAQKEIVELKTRLTEIEKQIKIIKEIEEKNATINNIAKILERDKLYLKSQIENGTSIGRNIKYKFSEFIKAIVGSDAVLSIEPLKTGNVNFRYDFLSDTGKVTNANKGHTYMKEICACMDLAIVDNYLANSYYRFTFHDGCLDGDDPRFAIAYLDLIKKLEKNGMQCIVTLIDSVIPKTADGSNYNIDPNDIVLELNDSPDGKGKLFGFNF